MSRDNQTSFQKALLESVVKDYDNLLQHEPDFVPSDQFEQWAQNMMRKKTYNTVHRVAKAVLIAALITALLAVSAFAIPAIKEALLNFFLVEHDDHYGITFDPEQAATAPEEIYDIYSISELPEGYFLLNEELSPAMISLLWANNNGDYISYTQWPVPQDATSDTWLGLHNETERQSVLMGNYLVEMLQVQDNRKLLWTDNAYVFCLEFSADLTQAEIDRMFFSWYPMEE